jgi:hypothetical protein
MHLIPPTLVSSDAQAHTPNSQPIRVVQVQAQQVDLQPHAAVTAADVERNIREHHESIRSMIEARNNAMQRHLENDVESLQRHEALRSLVDEQRNTVDAYLSKVDQKVDQILERVNTRDAPTSGSDATASRALLTTTIHERRSWRQRLRQGLRGFRGAAQGRFQLAAAAGFVLLLLLLTLLLVLLLGWSVPPTFLTAIATPLATPSTAAGPGAVQIDVQMAIDRPAQVPLRHSG